MFNEWDHCSICCTPSLAFIRICGEMEGEAWNGYTARTEFRVDYLPPLARQESPWGKRWPGLREALREATCWGDIIGQQGAIIPGSAWLEFHFEWQGSQGARGSHCIAKPLDSLAAAAEYLAPF